MGDNFILTNPEAIPHEPESVGELLRAARESAGFSLADIANRLRMGVKKIDAIERADYAALPAGIFLRGFIRNYAKIVGVDVEFALATLERTHTDGSAIDATKVVAPTAAVAPMNMHSRTEALATPKVRVLIVCGVILLLACAIWYWWEFVRPHRGEGGRPRPPDASAIEAQSSQPVAVLQPAVSPVEANITAGLLDANKAENDSAKNVETLHTLSAGTVTATTPQAIQPGTPAEPTPPIVVSAVASATVSASSPKATRRTSDTGLIGFTFTGQSWVEVIDGTGRTIMSRRYRAGDVDEISGRGPFSIVVGNADVTRMAYNGREFNLAPHIRSDSTVARVTVK
ncbi:MAG: RodZ domain-containing protein [Pseudomonadota bacterium]